MRSRSISKAEPAASQAAVQPRQSDLRRDEMREVGGTDDPWAVKFLKNDSAGFGPYRLQQIVRGQQAVFEARDDYWGEQAVHEDGHHARGADIGEPRSRCCTAARSTSRSSCSRASIESLKDEPNVAVDAVNASYMIWLELNTKIAPFDNVKVRRAMNLAIPRRRDHPHDLLRLCRPADGADAVHLPDGGPASSTTTMILDKAKELLARGRPAAASRRRSPTMPATRRRSRSHCSSRPRCARSASSSTLEKLPAGVFYENVTKRAKPMIFYLDSPVDAGSGLLDLTSTSTRRAT